MSIDCKSSVTIGIVSKTAVEAMREVNDRRCGGEGSYMLAPSGSQLAALDTVSAVMGIRLEAVCESRREGPAIIQNGGRRRMLGKGYRYKK